MMPIDFLADITAYSAPILIDIPGQVRANGAVHFWENTSLFPNGVLRCFWITEVKEGETRGNHAHWKESQVIVALAGKLVVNVEGIDGGSTQFELIDPGKGILVPPLNWVEVKFSIDAVLLGLSDRAFSEEDYIRDKDYFGNLQKRKR
ncbi:WxcM-like domain-containing protein [Algoriphagus lacus]|uniref:WxcM-like domain-containing protein n=1 Tax=Algoriphagus lacus TaxID=2056311 RepID=A0A418PP14_9BACT|nr:FdtA/QdtA family cupin domain-containing protein [Algoriphagus lacus]RIW13667.1 WxcM-like domain-containing protein [Algoriphagus lacus]